MGFDDGGRTGEWYDRPGARGDVLYSREEMVDDDRRRVLAAWRRFEESDAGRWVCEHTELVRALSDERSRTVPFLIGVTVFVCAVWSLFAWVFFAGDVLLFLLSGLPMWIVCGVACMVLWLFWDAYRDSDERAMDRLDYRPGLATRRQVAAVMGARAVMRDMVPAILPTMLDRWRRRMPGAVMPMPWMAAMMVGVSHRIDVWVDCEHHLYVLGPTRSGKTTCLVIPAVVEAPGFCLVTSTRGDIIMATRRRREEGVKDLVTGASYGGGRGRVMVFDPEGIGENDPLTRHSLKWTPLTGCDDPTIAKKRAETLVSIGGFGSNSNNREWGVSAGGFIQALLYAAAISDLPLSACYEWSISPEKAMKAAELIERHAPHGQMDSWADTVNALRTMDVKLRDNQWMGVRNAFAILSDPKVAARMDYAPHDPRLDDPKDMILRGDTVYVLSRPKRDGAGGSNAGTLVALLLDSFQDACQDLSQDPGTGGLRHKIEPPARFVLDELSNIEKWPALRNAITQGGGNGYQLIMVEQARAMMQKDYGREDEATIWGNSHRILMKGETDPDTLKWWTEQVGEYSVTRRDLNWNAGQGMLGGFNERQEREQSVKASDLSRMPRGTMICYPVGSPAPAFCRTKFWTTRGWYRPDTQERGAR